MCPPFAYARRNGNVYVDQGWSLLTSQWTPVVLMENNLLTWKWMASLAFLAYGTMLLDGCPRGKKLAFTQGNLHMDFFPFSFSFGDWN